MAFVTMFRRGARGSSSTYESRITFLFRVYGLHLDVRNCAKETTSSGMPRGPLRASSSASNCISLARRPAVASRSSVTRALNYVLARPVPLRRIFRNIADGVFGGRATGTA
ncbi:hypothetical protein MRX96_021824 [Rhipicephalus microplus]